MPPQLIIQYIHTFPPIFIFLIYTAVYRTLRHESRDSECFAGMTALKSQWFLESRSPSVVYAKLYTTTQRFLLGFSTGTDLSVYGFAQIEYVGRYECMVFSPLNSVCEQIWVCKILLKFSRPMLSKFEWVWFCSNLVCGQIWVCMSLLKFSMWVVLSAYDFFVRI